MLKRSLLEGIWDGSITALPSGERGQIAQVIERMIPVPAICLTGVEPIGDIRILPECTELLSGVSLGDVLAEELGVEVPYGALVIFEARNADVSLAVDPHYIERLIDQALRDMVLILAMEPQASVAASLALERSSRPLMGFRDHGLNARFFRGRSPSAPIAGSRATDRAVS